MSCSLSGNIDLFTFNFCFVISHLFQVLGVNRKSDKELSDPNRRRAVTFEIIVAVINILKEMKLCSALVVLLDLFTIGTVI